MLQGSLLNILRKLIQAKHPRCTYCFILKIYSLNDSKTVFAGSAFYGLLMCVENLRTLKKQQLCSRNQLEYIF